MVLIPMGELDLELINLEGLIKKLNSSLADHDEVIESETKDLLIPRDAKQTLRKGRYNLIQNGFGGTLLDALASSWSEINIGSISYEGDIVEDSAAYGGAYETVRLRIDGPIKLKKGDVLPACEIRLFAEIDDTMHGKLYIEREDYIPKFLYKKRTDLSIILPTEWF